MNSSIRMLYLSMAAVGLTLGALGVDAAVPDPATVAAAKTAADHDEIAKAYEDEAAALEKLAATHKNLGETYTTQAGGKPLHAAQAKHCGSVSDKLEAAAKDERALAAEHHELAHSASK